ncbi:hypothetical protein [Pseudomonas sp. NFX15]|uniref:AbiU2 domain-containing protein n=1 Tax=Pseudomonas sp. NFX15 TaxID=2816958 RepID=UPI003B8D1BA9
MDVQQTYENLLKQFQHIIFEDLTPKLSLFDVLDTRIQNDQETFFDKVHIFGYFWQSLETDVFLILAKLLDGKRSDRNIIRFIDFCESNRTKIHWLEGVIPIESIIRHKQHLADHRETINKITIRRDKFFAHSDKIYFLDRDKLDQDYPVRTSDLMDLTRCFQRIITDHSLGLNRSGRASPDGYFYVAADNLLNKLMYPDHFGCCSRRKMREQNP